MAQVSRRPLNKETWERIFSLFLETLVHIRNRDQLKNFVSEFLTPTERIVLAKRLAIAVLLSKGHDYTSIRNLLHVTPPTIAKVNFYLRYEGNGLKSVVEEIFKWQATQILWEEIKDVFDVPPYSANKAEWHKGRIVRAQKISRTKREF